MLETRFSSTLRKRRTRDWASAQAEDSLQSPVKRQKHSSDRDSHILPEFWDNLSEIHLTKGALKEIDRRSTINAVHVQSPLPQYKRPITRHLSRLIASSGPTVSAEEYLRKYSWGVEDLRRIAFWGGFDMSDQRGRSTPSIPLDQTKSSSRSASQIPRKSSTPASGSRRSTNTSNTGPYSRNFQQNLVDSGVYPDAYEYPDGQIPPLPSNWEEINQRLRKPRPSLSPSRFTEEDFRKFKRADAHAFKEKQVATTVIPIIEGHIKDARCVAGGIPFNNLDHLTDGTIVPGNPDVYYGTRPERLNRQVRDELSGLIVPSTQDDLPICPNLFLAAKGPDGSAAVAKRQASYDGALGARGMHALQLYGRNSSPKSNEAYTISSIYHDGTLKMYTSHRIDPVHAKGQPEYHMHQLRSFAMTDSVETFRQGAMYYRNARDWTEEQRNTAIDRANKVVLTASDELDAVSSPMNAPLGSETSVGGNTEQSPSIESMQQFVQLDGEQTSNTTVSLESFDTSLDQNTPNVDSSKRPSEHLKGTSPAQKRRYRAKDDRDLLPSKPNAKSTDIPTGLSQQFESHVLRQEEDDSDNVTELLDW